jgi:hypothetical protein
VPALVTLALHLLLDASSPWPSPCGRPLLRQPSCMCILPSSLLSTNRANAPSLLVDLRVRSSGACRHSTSRPREQASTRTVASVPHGGQRRGRRHLVKAPPTRDLSTRPGGLVHHGCSVHRLSSPARTLDGASIRPIKLPGASDTCASRALGGGNCGVALPLSLVQARRT